MPLSSQFLRESALRPGRWILRRWSDAEPRETAEIVSAERAEAWLLLNGHGTKDSTHYCVAAA